MSEADREKWDRGYREGSYRARTWPSPFLESWVPRMPRGRALDLACGNGRNALFLAAAGFEVDALDVSAVAIEQARAAARERGLDVAFRVADLDDERFAAGAYDLVTCVRYANRRTMQRIPEALREGGYLLFEHHFRTCREVGGPPWKGFRLRPNELLERFVRRLRVLHYEEDVVADPDGREMALARLVACRGSPGY